MRPVLGTRADREQTLVRVQCPVGLNKKSTLDSLFDWRFNLDRLLRMKMKVPDPSLQITTLLTIVERLTSRDPLFRHRLHTVITENNLHGFVRQRQILEFWSNLVADVRELEVVIGRGGSAAAVTQKTDKPGLSAVGIECEFLRRILDAGKAVCVPPSMRSCWLDKESATIVEHSVIEQVNALDLSNNREKDREERVTESKDLPGIEDAS